MRIVIVNWGRFADGAAIGGGVNGYCHHLARELVLLGHKVAWLQSGQSYVAHDGMLSPLALRRLPDELGVEQYTVFNSPVVAPGIFQAHDPLTEASAPKLEAELRSFYKFWRPQVVHYHNIEGFSAACIDSAVSAGASVYFSLHNYHTLCPQVYLVRHEGEHKYTCKDYDQGHACVSCLRSQLPRFRGSSEMRLRAGLDPNIPETHPSATTPDNISNLIGATLDVQAASPVLQSNNSRNHPNITKSNPHEGETGPVESSTDTPGRIGQFLPPVLYPVIGAVRRGLGLTQQSTSETTLQKEDNISEGDAFAQSKHTDAAKASGGNGHETTGETPEFPGLPYDALITSPGLSAAQPTEHAVHASLAAQPITNDITLPQVSHRVLHPYGQRRQRMIAALNRCTKVIAVSRFVEDLYRAHGVEQSKITTLGIGTRISARAGMLKAETADEHNITESPENKQTLRLAFIGYNNYYKGLGMLLDSLDLLPLRAVGNISLFIWAKDIERDRQRIDSMASRLAHLHVSGAYRYEDVPRMLSGVDAGIVPSLWWDNGPQTVMECLACGVPVIGAAVGGIVDQIEHGKNGLLFTGNDRPGLARLLEAAALDPRIVRSLRSNITPPKSMREHASELVSLYQQPVLQTSRAGDNP